MFNLDFFTQERQYQSPGYGTTAGGFAGTQISLADQLNNWWGSTRDEGGFLSNENLFGGEGKTGMVAPTLKGIGSVMSGWNAMQQLDLAKEQFAFSKQAYQTNLANQTQLTNQALVDRQNARAAANSSFQAPDEQWKKQNLLPANK